MKRRVKHQFNKPTPTEAMMKTQRRINSGNRSDSGRTTELMHAADKLARFQRISWKQAFGKIVAPAFRLHRYRNAHDRLLQDALCEQYRRADRGCGA